MHVAAAAEEVVPAALGSRAEALGALALSYAMATVSRSR